MKKALLSVSILAMTGSAFALPTGGFLSLDLGYVNIQKSTPTISTLSDASIKRNSTGGGVFAGYQTPGNFGVYFGANYYGKQSLTATETTAGDTTLNRTYYDVDLMLDTYYSLGNQLSVYASGGAAYIFTNTSGTVSLTKNKNASWWRPKAAIGLDFAVSKQFAIGVSYSRIFGTGNIDDLLNSSNGKDYLPNLDLASINFTYLLGTDDA